MYAVKGFTISQLYRNSKEHHCIGLSKVKSGKNIRNKVCSVAGRSNSLKSSFLNQERYVRLIIGLIKR